MTSSLQDLPTDPCFLTVAQASELIAARRLSPAEYADALIARAERLDPVLHAYLLPTFDRARSAARAAEAEIAASGPRGPLHGIPYGLKDVYDVAGLPTTGQSRPYADSVAAADSACAARLDAAGGVLLGKLSTHENAHGGPSFDLAWPAARNPWNPDHFTGGSSSGSGAAVAAGLMPLAMGTDTGGSIRNPAALCGLTGIKPTFGLISRVGIMPNSYSYDHAGPMAWTARDCAVAMQVLAGHDGREAASARAPVPDYVAALTGDLRGLRVGVVRHFFEEDAPVAPAVHAALEDAFAVLRSLGAVLEDVRLRPLVAYADAKIVTAESEILAVHEPRLRARPDDFGEDFLSRVLPALLFSGADYVQAQRLRRTMAAEFDRLHERFDLLVTAAPSIAPRLDQWQPVHFWERHNSFVTPFNVSGGPALVQCIGFSEGLPIALQVAGRPFEDALVLRAADAYERATGWRAVRPAEAAMAAPVTAFPVPEPAPSALSEAERDELRTICRRAGIAPGERAFAHLCAAAPHARAMRERLDRAARFADEPAAIVSLAPPGQGASGRGAARLPFGAA